jgi:hypothetical protein
MQISLQGKHPDCNAPGKRPASGAAKLKRRHTMIASIGGSSSLGQVSMAEMRQRMFSKIDTNSDGKHDKDELTQMVAQGPQGGPRVDDIFSKLDTDEDGSISESEFKAGDKPDQQVQQAGDAEDKLLKALLEALEKEKQSTSGTGNDGSQSSNTAATISEMLSTALKTYMQSSSNGFSQVGAQNFLGSGLYA